ncbi:unnamed protein product [Linum tenue]|uniref:C2H2-type domain-containing protein n=1 Tax=Linum tenue TaxID=586396 RepID=A0AAV0PM07_9ROSI|nr:unnamed protein product [Linum tenue]
MAVKRSGGVAEPETFDMAKCLVYLSHGLNAVNSTSKPSPAAFECKTCNRTFPSFQALGGHRASHGRPKNLLGLGRNAASKLASRKPKMHECSICGVEFALGQALGGHMRRHRAAPVATRSSGGDVAPPLAVGPGSNEVAVLLRRSSSSKRVFFGLDLNLTPLQNDLEYLFGKIRAPKAPPFDPSAKLSS